MTDYAADLDWALALADRADALALKRFESADLSVSTKADRTFVTDADTAVESLIKSAVEADKPADAFWGEEAGGTHASGRQWIVDPIDGTSNFLRGVPVWGTLIALLDDGEPVLGLVSAPALGQRWWASRGAGAYSRGRDGTVRRIQVSGVDRLENASLSFQSIAQWRDAGHLNTLLNLADQVWRDRAYGDMWSYMLLAEGRLDIVAEFDVKPYDLAALIPIVREAGGRFTSVDGLEGPWHGSALATNGLLHESVLDKLRS